ncbi:MAG: helix-turn-helix domain-containing protein [Halanaerobiales bacterium]
MSRTLNREISIIYDLLFGYTDKMKNIRQQLDSGDFKLPVDTAVVIKINNRENILAGMSEFQREELKRQTLNWIREIAGKYSPDILADFVEDDTMILYFSSTGISTRGEKNEILNIARNIKQKVETETLLKISLGIGRSYEDLKGLIFSYREALNACTTGYFMGENITHIDDIVQMKKEIPIFVSEMEEELISMVRKRETADFNRLFREIVEAVIEEGVEPEVIKTRVMDLAFKVIREIDRKNNKSEDSFLRLSGYLEKILEVKTREELNQLVDKLSEKFFGILQRKGKKDNSKEEILLALDYIEENYHRDLALQEVAREVGLSQYYFSHLFKEETGDTFISYLNKIRINKAKQLLGEKDLNIAEICYRVGFNDPNYFTRVFKEYEEMTPSQYRKKRADKNIL